MSFERAPISIVRSIRHVSLVKGWARARRTVDLPHYSNFVRDERADDELDLMVVDVHRENSVPLFFCRSAGTRIEQIFNRPLGGAYFKDSIGSQLSTAVRPFWMSCIVDRLPVYVIFSITDRNGCLVTIEQILLPYFQDTSDAEVVATSIHAWSAEGRFEFGGLLTNMVAPPQTKVVIVDPSIIGAATDDSRLEII